MHADVPEGKEVHAVINIEVKSIAEFKEEKTLIFRKSHKSQLQVILRYLLTRFQASKYKFFIFCRIHKKFNLKKI